MPEKKPSAAEVKAMEQAQRLRERMRELASRARQVGTYSLAIPDAPFTPEAGRALVAALEAALEASSSWDEVFRTFGPMIGPALLALA